MTFSGIRKPAAELVQESDLDPDAIRVVGRLARADHEAYLVGGCVRDVLIGRRPKDFDIATSATPRQVRRLFTNSRIIGRRFLLAHVSFGDKILEVSTFRKAPQSTGEDGDHLIVRDNIFGTAEEDALRRDFTINALFYDAEEREIVDHVGGLPDIEARILRTIGVPRVRIQEDPVRIIRAARLKAQIGFTLEESLLDAMREYSSHIRKSAPPRVQEEIFKILESGASREAIRILIEVGCFAHIYPTLAPREEDREIEEIPKPVETPEEAEPEGVEDRILDWDAHLPGADEFESPEMLQEDVEEPAPSPPGRDNRILERLAALDELVRERGRPPRPVLLAVLILDGVKSISTERDAFRLAWQFLSSFRTNNRVSRKDAETCSQIIALQRKLFGETGGGRSRRRPEHLIRLRYFREALALADVDTRSRKEQEDVVRRWEERARQGGEDPFAIYQKVGSPGRRAAGRSERGRASSSRRDRRSGRRGRGSEEIPRGGAPGEEREGRPPSSRGDRRMRDGDSRTHPAASNRSAPGEKASREERQPLKPTPREGRPSSSRGDRRMRDGDSQTPPAASNRSAPGEKASREERQPLKPTPREGKPPSSRGDRRMRDGDSQTRPAASNRSAPGEKASREERQPLKPTPREGEGSRPEGKKDPGRRPESKGGDRSGKRPPPIMNVVRASEPEATPPKATRRARGWVRLTRGQRPKRKRVARKRV